MEAVNTILNFLRNNFFYDFRSTVITFCVIFTIIYMRKMLNDDGKNTAKSVKYIVLTTMFFFTFLIFY